MLQFSRDFNTVISLCTSSTDQFMDRSVNFMVVRMTIAVSSSLVAFSAIWSAGCSNFWSCKDGPERIILQRV